MDINIRKNSGDEPEEKKSSFTSASASAKGGFVSGEEISADKKAMEGEENAREEHEEWDMPISGEAGKAQESKNTSQNFESEKSEFQDSEVSKFKDFNVLQFKDARPKIHEVTVSIGNPKILDYWRAASRWAMILFAAIAPIFFLPITGLPVAANKELLVFILILASSFALLGRILLEGRVRYPGHMLMTALLVLVLVWGASAFFSVNQVGSLIGSWATPDSFAAMLLFSILALGIIMTFDRRDIILSILVFLSSLSVLGIFELLQLMKIFVLPFDFGKSAVFNPIGSTNDLGVLLAFGLIIASGLMSTPDMSKLLKKLLGISVIVFILNLVIIDFWAIWVGLSLAMIFMISFISIGLQTHNKELGTRNLELSKSPSSNDQDLNSDYHGLQLAYFEKAWMPSVILLISVLLLFIPSPFAKFIQTPLEVSPNYGATLNIAFENLKAGNYLFGSGPNTFGYIFNLYKPSGINQTIFWSTVFNSGASALATWVGTAGILGALALLFLIFAFIWTGIAGTAIRNSSRGIMNVASQAVFIAVSFLFAMWFIHVANFTILAFTFWGIGLFLAASLFFMMENASNPSISTSSSIFKEIRIFTSPPKTFLFSLLVIGLMVGAVIGIYFEINRYAAEVYFSKAIAVSPKDNNEAINNLSKAVQFWPYDERYFQAMSQAVFLQINPLLARKDLPQDTLRVQFQNLTSNAISYAQKAKNLNPKNSFNSVLLGSIYENLISFIADASNFALSSYGAAIALDPKNPSDRLALARVQIIQANLAISKKSDAGEINNYLDKAISNLEEAISLKGDYAPARFLEVQIYDRQGKLADAIKRAEELVALNNTDVGTLFQLGFLYYKAGRFDESRQVFERTVSLSPNYSNAMYFLGLIYDQSGAKDKAIEQFSKIADLNPDNNEVKRIIINLKAKKPALFGIAPPAPAPQNRSEAPVPEGAKTPVRPLKK